MRGWLFALFLFVFALFYGSADFLTSLHGLRIEMGPTGWPFWPGWSAVYLSLDLFIPLSFALVSRDKLGSFTSSLVIATALAWPFFLFLPLRPISIPFEYQPGLFFWLADLMNLNHNLLPSLHVTYAILCAAALGRWWSILWATGITFSVLLTHQHYTVDAAAGLLLAYLAYRAVNGIEALCLQEFARCAGRHRRYAVIALAIYLASLTGWRRRRLARVGFCYLQHLDDLLDGQEPCEVEPEEVASLHQRALRGEVTFPESPLGRLGEAFHGELSKRGHGVDLAVALIEEMKLDRVRVRDKRLLDEGELDRHLERTFELSLDLMLLAADSTLRSSQAPHLLKVLGWCSVIRDYSEDQSLGLINVPREAWESGRTEAWLEQRHAQALSELTLAQAELDQLRGHKGHGLLGIFLRSVKRYARNYRGPL